MVDMYLHLKNLPDQYMRDIIDMVKLAGLAQPVTQKPNNIVQPNIGYPFITSLVDQTTNEHNVPNTCDTCDITDEDIIFELNDEELNLDIDTEQVVDINVQGRNKELKYTGNYGDNPLDEMFIQYNKWLEQNSKIKE